jgi:hypothetical protein
VLLPILLLHALRHLGLMFLARGAVFLAPPAFAVPAALGDFPDGAPGARVWPVASGAAAARPLVWLFNVVGTIDLIDAITLATVYDAAAYMGPAY